MSNGKTKPAKTGRSETKLRRSELRYRRLFEAAKDGILMLDPVTRKITEANPFIATFLGYTREQLLKKELWQIGLLKDEAASQAAFRALKKNGFIRYEDLPLESKSGVRLEVEFVSNLYREGGDEVIQCNIRDITARKRIEEALSISEARFRALFELEPIGIYSCNPQLEAAVLPSAAKIVAAAQGVVAGVVAASRRPRVQAAAADRVTPAPEGKPTAARPAPKISSAAREKDPADGEAIRLPHGDLTVSEAKVLHWRKQPGDGFSAGEVIAEVETDKAVMEVEAPAAGRLVRIAAPAGAVVPMGGLLAVFTRE